MRNKLMRLTWGLVCLAAQGFTQELLIDAEALQKRLDKVVILHSGSKTDYEAGHIPGARLVGLPDLSVTGAAGLRLELPSEAAFRAKLLEWGISDDSEVVIYTGNDSVQSATRVWFTFDYFSVKAKMLDGGIVAWKSKGFSLETATPSVQAAQKVTLKARPELVVDAAWIQSRLKDADVMLVDARLPEFYTGENPGQMARGGRIPGAKNLPFPSFLQENKQFLPRAELASKMGDSPTIVTYCHIGMQATVAYFSARLSGKNVKLYDGSFQDWSSRSELPVESK